MGRPVSRTAVTRWGCPCRSVSLFPYIRDMAGWWSRLTPGGLKSATVLFSQIRIFRISAAQALSPMCRAISFTWSARMIASLIHWALISPIWIPPACPRRKWRSRYRTRSSSLDVRRHGHPHVIILRVDPEGLSMEDCHGCLHAPLQLHRPRCAKHQGSTEPPSGGGEGAWKKNVALRSRSAISP